ncbi:MAG: hypothetical protein GY820_46170, partial [Gammaproteobacteria bacterium]|nr:hypothetical protein [Gammaproteobacteria bacterium]
MGDKELEVEAVVVVVESAEWRRKLLKVLRIYLLLLFGPTKIGKALEEVVRLQRARKRSGVRCGVEEEDATKIGSATRSWGESRESSETDLSYQNGVQGVTRRTELHYLNYLAAG